MNLLHSYSQDSRAAIQRETIAYDTWLTGASQIAETRDRYSLHQKSINHLASKTLLLAVEDKASDELFQTLSCLAILQSDAVSALVVDLPSLFIKKIHISVDEQNKRNSPSETSLIHLAAVMNISGRWLQHYWTDTVEVMNRCMSNGGVLPVLQGIDLILDGCD